MLDVSLVLLFVIPELGGEHSPIGTLGSFLEVLESGEVDSINRTHDFKVARRVGPADQQVLQRSYITQIYLKHYYI